MFETQFDLEEIYAKNNLIPRLKVEFSELTDDPFDLMVLVQMYLHRQANVTTLVGVMLSQFRDLEAQDVADRLWNCVAEKDLIDYDVELEKFIVVYLVSEDIEKEIALYQYPLPMVETPRNITNNFMSGYLTLNTSVILNGSSQDDVCVEHLNRCSLVPLELNMKVAHLPIEKPKRKSGEDLGEFNKRKRQWQTFYDVSMDVMESLVILGNKLYLTHRYDRRGRTYSSGYHVNTQGTDYNKAVIGFHHKEIVTS